MDSEDNSRDSASSSTSKDMICDSVVENVSRKEKSMEKSHIEKENGFIPSVRDDSDTQNNGVESDDEFEAFGKSIIAQMRKLPEEYAVVLMSEIQTLLTRKRLKYIMDKRRPNMPQSPTTFVSQHPKTFPL